MNTLQAQYFGKLLELAREKKEVSGITQNYLDALMTYIKTHPKAGDAPEAMLQIELVYRALGKAVEANAWREKLNKEYPNSPAAKTRQGSRLTPERSMEAQILRAYLDVDDLILKATPPAKE